MWHGWIEFDLLDESGRRATLRSPRETTQPNRTDTEYWATGLTPVYLEGALTRALKPPPAPVPLPGKPVFDGPAPDRFNGRHIEPRTPAILDPFSVYEKGESLLRKQLAALSSWHLVNIIAGYEISGADSTSLTRLPHGALIELIVDAVRTRVSGNR